jgi:DcmR-like sensory protein
LKSRDNRKAVLNIEEGSVLDILDKFKKEPSFGEHNMLIYPDRHTLRELYSRACKMALENNEAVIILLHCETRNDILTFLRDLDIDVYNYEKRERTLLIIDSAKKYFGSPKDFLFYLNIMNANASRRNKRGILVLMDHHQIISQTQRRINSLMEYEELIPAKLDINVKILCLYHVKNFDILEQVDEKEYLLRLHFRQYKIKDDYNYHNTAENKAVPILC